MIKSEYVLTSLITSVRHGHKDDLGELTEIGIEQARKIGERIDYLAGETLLFHSGVGRVARTIEEIYKVKNVNPDKISSYESHFLHYLYNPQVKGNLFANWDNSLQDPELRINAFLSQGESTDEPDIYPSPKEMAVRFARVLITQIDFVTITIPDVMTNFINGTHEPVMMSFLYYFLNDYNPEKADGFADKIGGSIDFSEGFNVSVFQQVNMPTKLVFNFRDIEKDMNQNELRKFASG